MKSRKARLMSSPAMSMTMAQFMAHTDSASSRAVPARSTGPSALRFLLQADRLHDHAEFALLLRRRRQGLVEYEFTPNGIAGKDGRRDAEFESLFTHRMKSSGW